MLLFLSLALSALVVAGTFAWTNFGASIINSFTGAEAGGGSQHEGPGGNSNNIIFSYFTTTSVKYLT